MKVKVITLGLGTAIATTVYYIAICIVVVFAGIIIVKLMFWPPCTVNGKQCVVDGWSIAGLAATILGVSTTVLTLLGAFAVAAWWTRLDRRVREQVDASLRNEEQTINNRLNTFLTEQEKRIDAILSEQEMKVKETIADVEAEFGKIGRQFDAVRRITADAALLNPPWVIEGWVLQLVTEFEMIDVAARMVSKYLDYLDSYLSTSSSDFSEHELQPSQMKPPSSDPIYYWERALRWQKIVESYRFKEPEQAESVKDSVNAHLAKVEDWKQRYSTLSKKHEESTQSSEKRNE